MRNRVGAPNSFAHVNDTSNLIEKEKPSRRKLFYIAIVVGCGVMLYLILGMMELDVRNSYNVQSSRAKEGDYSIVINTFQRHDMMKEAVQHYSQCAGVKSIHIVWSETKPPNKKLAQEYDRIDKPKIGFEVHTEDSLNNRFKPLQRPHAEGIFAVDDDMRVPCAELDLGYEVWRSNSRTLVGFMPRIHIRGSSGLIYRCWWRVWWYGEYSMILTKAAFMHHDYFAIYSGNTAAPVRAYVDEHRNCEDIAMQFLIANVTTLPPVYVKGHLNDLGALNGISTSKNVISAGHMDERSECLNDMVKLFGRVPLVSSHIIVDAAANRWNNAPSTWWEYISSDLWNIDS